MDSTEAHVGAHLKHRGFTDVAYEPDGNVPPDFLVYGTIAIEVRRLNQNHFGESKAKGLEEVAIPLWNKIKTLLSSLGAPARGDSGSGRPTGLPPRRRSSGAEGSSFVQ